MNFTNIKKNYDKGFWDIQMVRVAVEKGIINEAQFETITGFVFKEMKW